MMSIYMSHIPVLLEEIKTALELKAGDVYVDGTLGLAGHAKAMYLAADKRQPLSDSTKMAILSRKQKWR